MALTVRGKTLLLLGVGAAIVVLLILPLRFTPNAPQSIDTLSLQARTQLVQRYEPLAKNLRRQADSLRAILVAQFGGTKPSQDELLAVLETGSEHMLSIIGHLRDPRRATFEEKGNDISRLLEQDLTDAREAVQQLDSDSR